MELNDSVSKIKGVGPKKREALEAVGIQTVNDLLQWFPRRYDDKRVITPIAELEPGKKLLVEAKLISRRYSGYRYKKKAPLALLADDGTGTLEIVFFNGSYLSNLFNVGKIYSFFGAVTENNGRLQMIHPEFHMAGDKDDIRGLVPEYPPVPGISQPMLRKFISDAMEAASGLEEWLPEKTVKKYHLAGPAFSLTNLHFPSDEKKILQGRYRMVFEEMIVMEAGIASMRASSRGAAGTVIDSSFAKEFIDELPFDLTEGQKSAWSEIAADLASTAPMNRLVQGDVGSGKTVIAETAAYCAVRSGYQAAMMVPTELLANQHYETFTHAFSKFGIRIGLLNRGMKAGEKKALLDDLAAGRIDIIVGTHAIIEPGVVFKNLGLVITDEQHRFGVNQRKLLSEKGREPDVMVMTATPIPRTLAVIVFGDLDISEIRSMPKGRKKIKTSSGYPEDRPAIYDFVGKQLQEGRQSLCRRAAHI